MKKKNRKKKLKIPIKKTLFVSLLILIVLFLFLFYTNNFGNYTEVNVKKLDFIHVGDKEYVLFDIKNPTEVEKVCSYRIVTAVGEYTPDAKTILQPQSKKNVRLFIEVPSGKSKVNVFYTCK